MNFEIQDEPQAQEIAAEEIVSIETPALAECLILTAIL